MKPLLLLLAFSGLILHAALRTTPTNSLSPVSPPSREILDLVGRSGITAEFPGIAGIAPLLTQERHAVRPEHPPARAGATLLILRLCTDQGVAIGNSTVRVTAPGEDAREPRSTVDGYVRVAVPPGKSLSIAVGGGPWARSDTSCAALEPGEHRDLGSIRLVPGLALSGIVLGSDDLALEDVDVALVAVKSRMQALLGPRRGTHVVPLCSARTDSAGRFVLRGVSAGAYRIVARTPGWADVEVNVNVPGAREDTIRIRMVVTEVDEVRDASILVAGRIVQYGGKPVPDAAVWIEDPVTGRTVAPPASTDPQGRFSLSVPAAGEYVLDVRSWAGSHSRSISASSESRPIEIVLDGELPLAVRVFDQDGTPLTASSVEVRPARTPDTPKARPCRGRTGSDGWARFFDLDAGSMEIRVRPEGHAPVARTLNWDGDPDVVDVHTSRPGRLRVLVIDSSGRVVPFCDLTLLRIDGEENPLPADQRTDMGGLAVWVAIPAGRYVVVPSVRVGADPTVRTLHRGPDPTILIGENESVTTRLVMPCPVLRVSVSRVGEAAVGAGVGYAPAGDDSALLRATVIGAPNRKTGGDGVATLVLPRAGNYTIFARSNVNAPYSVWTGRIDAGTQVLEIALHAGVVTGRLVRSDGTHVPHARVRLCPQGSETSMSGRRVDASSRPFVTRLGETLLETDSEGRFSFTDLDGGAYELHVEHDDHASPDPRPLLLIQGQRIELGTIELETHCTLHGTVTGHDVLAAVVRIHREEQLVGSREIEEDRRYEFADLPPGTYRISVQTRTGRIVEELIELTLASSVHDIDLSDA